MKPRRVAGGSWFFLFLFPLSSSELYSALAGLETLLDTERAIIDALDDYLEMEDLRLKKLERRIFLKRKLSHQQKWPHQSVECNSPSVEQRYQCAAPHCSCGVLKRQ